MRELPISFSTEMVYAILNGIKTQTRRLSGLDLVNEYPKEWKFKHFFDLGEKKSYAFFMQRMNDMNVRCQVPYGQTGDLLWVREEHKITIATNKKALYVEYKDGKTFGFHKKDLTEKTWNNLIKRKTIGKWQRARFLPKELSRIWLINKYISAERLYDISEHDAIAEGIEKISSGEFSSLYRNYILDGIGPYQPVSSFISLFRSIYGNELTDKNPWVFAIQFKVLSTSGKPTNLTTENTQP